MLKPNFANLLTNKKKQSNVFRGGANSTFRQPSNNWQAHQCHYLFTKLIRLQIQQKKQWNLSESQSERVRKNSLPDDETTLDGTLNSSGEISPATGELIKHVNELHRPVLQNRKDPNSKVYTANTSFRQR